MTADKAQECTLPGFEPKFEGAEGGGLLRGASSSETESPLPESKADFIGYTDEESETEDKDFSLGRGSGPLQHTLGSRNPLSCAVGTPTCAREALSKPTTLES